MKFISSLIPISAITDFPNVIMKSRPPFLVLQYYLTEVNYSFDFYLSDKIQVKKYKNY